MKVALYPLCLCLLAQPALAEKAPSIMFDPPQRSISGSTSLEPPPSDGDRCEALLQKIEQLKGKPQRKHSMIERYQLECGQPE
jgi:hypothetical protein